MKIIMMIVLMGLLWSISPLASSNAYLASNTYESFYVQSGDTLWHIAGRYVTDKDDIRELTYAITEINKLNKNAQIYPGQILKIPVKNSR